MVPIAPTTPMESGESQVAAPRRKRWAPRHKTGSALLKHIQAETSEMRRGQTELQAMPPGLDREDVDVISLMEEVGKDPARLFIKNVLAGSHGLMLVYPRLYLAAGVQDDIFDEDKLQRLARDLVMLYKRNADHEVFPKVDVLAELTRAAQLTEKEWREFIASMDGNETNDVCIAPMDVFAPWLKLMGVKADPRK